MEQCYLHLKWYFSLSSSAVTNSKFWYEVRKKVVEPQILFGSFFRCASISCTVDRMWLTDWSELEIGMFDSSRTMDKGALGISLYSRLLKIRLSSSTPCSGKLPPKKKTGKCGNFSQVGDPPPSPLLGMTCFCFF